MRKLDHLPLSQRELNILSMLAEGHSYEETYKRLKMSAANLHVTAARIRKKTGIRSTLDAKQCAAWLRRPIPASDKHYELLKAKGLFTLPPGHRCTARQIDVLQRLHNGQSYRDIAKALGIVVETAHLHASNGRKAMGLQRQWVPVTVEPSRNVDDY